MLHDKERVTIYGDLRLGATIAWRRATACAQHNHTDPSPRNTQVMPLTPCTCTTHGANAVCPNV